MTNVRVALAGFVVILFFGIVAFETRKHDASAASLSAEPQDPATLDRRISGLEQRLYFLESSMRRVEQQVVQRPTSVPDQQRTETVLLRNDIETLKAQLQSINCALAKLDERTLPPESRQAARENTFKDPCRMNPQTPLHLPTNP